MGIKRLYIVRHGQTDFNKNGIVQGSGVDAPLNELGRLQADTFYQAYKNFRFDKIYVSGLQRTMQSVENFLQIGIPMEQLDDLNEINWGDREGKAFDAEGNTYYFSMLKKWQNGLVNMPISGGESPIQVADRLKRAIDHICSGPEQEILVCMHGRAMRILFCVMLNYPLHNMDIFEHSNLCLYQWSFNGHEFNLEKFNDQKHLESLHKYDHQQL